jgi:antitoxin component of MazEF toxin-antitoxin module
MTLERKLRKIGHSSGIIIPVIILELLKIEKDSKLILTIKNDKIIIEKEQIKNGGL